MTTSGKHEEKIVWEDVKKNTNIHKNHSYALNVQLVMVMQEIVGCGTEADILCSFLNLPHGHTFKNYTFIKIEDKLERIIRDITTQAMKGALDEEICLQLKKMEEKVITIK